MKLHLTLTSEVTLDLDKDRQTEILEKYIEDMDPDPVPKKFSELSKDDIYDTVRQLLEDDINWAEFNFDADSVQIEVIE